MFKKKTKTRFKHWKQIPQSRDALVYKTNFSICRYLANMQCSVVYCMLLFSVLWEGSIVLFKLLQKIFSWL